MWHLLRRKGLEWGGTARICLKSQVMVVNSNNKTVCIKLHVVFVSFCLYAYFCFFYIVSQEWNSNQFIKCCLVAPAVHQPAWAANTWPWEQLYQQVPGKQGLTELYTHTQIFLLPRLSHSKYVFRNYIPHASGYCTVTLFCLFPPSASVYETTNSSNSNVVINKHQTWRRAEQYRWVHQQICRNCSFLVYISWWHLNMSLILSSSSFVVKIF